MYHLTPCKVVEAEAFMRLPDHLRRDKGADLTPWAQQQHPGVPIAAFLEGPSFDRAGNLYCVDIAHGRIFKTTPDGTVSVVTEYDGEPNGLKIHKDGRIFVADYRNGIVTVDPATGAMNPVLERARLERFRGCNDLVFASNGDLYFTDQGQSGMHDPTGRVFRLRPNGQIDKILDNVPSPNGLVLNAPENVLYLAVTRANCVWRVRLLSDGTATKVGVFVQLSGGLAGPDGLALNDEDGLAIAHAGYGVVWICNRLGDPVIAVRSPEGIYTTNVAYGGADRHVSFVHEISMLRAQYRNAFSGFAYWCTNSLAAIASGLFALASPDVCPKKAR